MLAALFLVVTLGQAPAVKRQPIQPIDRLAIDAERGLVFFTHRTQRCLTSCSQLMTPEALFSDELQALQLPKGTVRWKNQRTARLVGTLASEKGLSAVVAVDPLVRTAAVLDAEGGRTLATCSLPDDHAKGLFVSAVVRGGALRLSRAGPLSGVNLPLLPAIELKVWAAPTLQCSLTLLSRDSGPEPPPRPSEWPALPPRFRVEWSKTNAHAVDLGSNGQTTRIELATVPECPSEPPCQPPP